MLEKILYFNNRISTEEWSGILLYKLTGNFASGNFYCTVKDIFPMNIGNSVYTEYEYDANFIKYRMANPDSLDWDLGHVHSHNTMTTFFSGTDTDELKENINNHNYYLSLIVNNAMKPTAKIAFKGTRKVKEENVYKFNFFGNTTSFNKGSRIIDEEVMFTYDCNIEFKQKFNVPTSFVKRIDDIIRIKEDKKLKLQQGKANALINKTHPKPVYSKYEQLRDNPYAGEFGEYGYFDRYKDNYNTKPSDSFDTYVQQSKQEAEALKDLSLELEELLADALCTQYNSQKDIEEALFLGNVEFKRRGDEYIDEVVMFITNMFPAYFVDVEYNQNLVITMIEILNEYGGDTFSALVETLAVKLI